MTNIRKILLILWLTNLSFSSSQSFGSLKSELKPTRKGTTNQIQSYKQCRKDVLKKHRKRLRKSKKKAVKAMKKGVQRCRNLYPAAVILADCRKQAIKDYKHSKEYLPTALAECRTTFRRLKFGDKDYQPIRVAGKKVLFAGVSLSQTRFLKKSELKKKGNNLNLAHFDCSNLAGTFRQEYAPEHLLFGNQVQNFIPLKNVKSADLVEQLSIQADEQGKAELTHPVLGLLSYNSNDDSVISYLPVSQCMYTAGPKSPLESVKIYYLINRKKKSATPYFAIAFYKETSKIPLSQLTEEVSQELGDEYKISRSSDGVDFFSQVEITSFDDEGDPKDLCQFPRQFKLVGVLASKGKHAKYLLLSNIANLCMVGDQIASQFLKNGDPK